ncbi:MAG: transglycosylase SLT domain-containing protein [Bdellovibrionota bacterium]
MAKWKHKSLSQLVWGSLLTLTLTACATDSHRALVPIELDAGAKAGAETPLQSLETMRKILKDDESLRPMVEDILAMAEASALEEQQKFVEAEAFWLKSLKLDRGAVGKAAFEGWANLQPKIDLANGHNPDFVASKLLSVTKEGEESPWLKRQGLTQKASLSKRLDKIIGLKLAETPSAVSVPKPSLPDPDSFPKADDLYYEARAKAVCRKPLDAKWVNWLSSLSVAQRVYWNGLIFNCEGQPRRSSVEFRAATEKLSTSPEDTARVIRSAELLISALKAIGDRVGATEAYAIQASVLKRNDLPLDILGWSVYEKQKRFIDSTYWVARNRAMQGDYVRAKAAVQDGLDGLAILEPLAKTSKETAQVSELRVEGFHVLSSRIQYEQGDFAGAVITNQNALAVTGITKEWRGRLQWSEGWYLYRQGDKARAVESLTRYLAEDLEDSSRTKALYWRGRSLLELGEKSEAEKDFEELTRIAPLSFYAVVGIPTIDPDVDWTDNFKKADEDRLSKIEDFEWGVWNTDADAMRRFHRLEFVIASKFKDLYPGLASELFDAMNGKPKLLREVEPSLYATRLMHMAEQYVLSISLSSSLSQIHNELWTDYPEQLLVFFPRAYREDVLKFAAKQGIEAELVWGLSRQESSFRKTVESPVGAIGLMQIMPNTGEELARLQGLSASGISERLKQSDTNLQLGTLYLANLGKRYQGKWPRAIAAYNAGEYVVDTWMLRRDAPDMIMWSEALSFGETSSYVKNVWRNWEVYRWLSKHR